ncbi:MAG: aminotransferase class I/II-fold pyridoxal phosphate-dependent enzyme [Aquificaceae bacterium]|nr:aminotransferase class I/II-fold pyridoxal phosphate-dependent enzyme [Aquificaceae bacterium]
MGRLDRISPFLVMDILQEALRTEDVVHMEIGEPDLEPPPGVTEAMERAVRERRYFYTPSLGLWELRERIAEHYYAYYGVEVSPSRVVVTTGTSSAFLLVYALLLSAGERVVLSDPSYPCYKNFAYLLDLEPIMLKVDRSTKYQITPEHLEGLEGYSVVHISTPANPTGNLYEEDNLRALASFCEGRGLYLICDEIYHGLVYEKRERTALEFSQRAIVINGFSKAFCMPGFRLGWVILPDESLVRKAELILQNLYISAPTLSQYAALEAFDYNHLSRVRDTYKKRRDLLLKELEGVGRLEIVPEGAFYVWLDISQYGLHSYELSLKLLREAKVATTPGVDFGKNKTEKYIRISFAKDGGTLREGAKRIRDYLIR